ncbi:MAG: IS1380 family transposase, partial [Candidatus Lokiarchaeota archaeon]|nr:IS1380 family transposase [Candidatus Lokiarchaeota archaeon]
MKNCTKQLLIFKDISCKKIEADFEGGEVSSDAGVLFLRAVENRIG